MCAGCAGDEDGLDQSTWFQRCVSLPLCGRWRMQRVCMRVCVLTEQVGELLCHLKSAWSCTGAIGGLIQVCVGGLGVAE